MTIPFWVNEPSVLFNKTYVFELFPTSKMSYNRQMNSISRLIILLTIVGYLITLSLKLIFISIATLFIIFLVHQQKGKKPIIFENELTSNDIRYPTHQFHRKNRFNIDADTTDVDIIMEKIDRFLH